MSLVEIKNDTGVFASINSPQGKVALATGGTIVRDDIEVKANIEKYGWDVYVPSHSYLCFTAQESTDIAWTVNGELVNEPQLQYSIDSTNNWVEYVLNDTVSLESGQKCYWKGTTTTFSESPEGFILFSSTGAIAASGEVDSLINWGALTDYCYVAMFGECSNLTQAPELPATTLADYCYTSMFYGCTSLKLSTTQDSTYKTSYRIPTNGTGTTASDALTGTFGNTGGTFIGTPSINTTYYGAW